jgi:putative zinc- or iron-chelating protein
LRSEPEPEPEPEPKPEPGHNAVAMSAPTKRRLPVAKPAVLERSVLEGIADGEAHVAVEAFTRGPAGVAEAAVGAAASAARLFAAAERAAPPKPPIACQAGCSHCCHEKVLVVAPEAIRLAEHLRESLPAAAFERLVEQVRATDELTRGLSRDERTARSIPCPLLDRDGTCSAYVARPIVCGGWASLDVDACARRQGDRGAAVPPVFVAGYEAGNAVLAGLGKACFDAGLDGTPLELVAALRVALERPNAAERFLAKRPIFAPARDREWLEKNARAPGK